MATQAEYGRRYWGKDKKRVLPGKISIRGFYRGDSCLLIGEILGYTIHTEKKRKLTISIGSDDRKRGKFKFSLSLHHGKS